MPAQAERVQMDTFEDRLEALIKTDKAAASLTQVSTGNNVRRWVYYADSINEFKKLVEKARSESPHIQIVLDSTPDPTWAQHEQFRREVAR